MHLDLAVTKILLYRRDYIELLNANTLSLDGMAALNSDLRGLVHDENWNKHAHVQWVVDKAHDISLFFIENLKELYEHKEYEKIMDKLIESLIGPYAEGGTETGHWDRNILTHLNLALLGIDDDSTDKKRKPAKNEQPVALVPAMNGQTSELVTALVGQFPNDQRDNILRGMVV